MKIAIPVQNSSAAMQVDGRFGRAAAFCLVDTDTEARSCHDNAQNATAARGAGVQAAQTVVDLGAEAVLAGHIGPKAFAVLKAAGIKVFTGVDGPVDDAVAAWCEGLLTAADDADVEGHWV